VNLLPFTATFKSLTREIWMGTDHLAPRPQSISKIWQNTRIFLPCSLSNCVTMQRIQRMHILPFLGSTTSSILGTGVGSSMSLVRSSCSSSSFCPLLFPYKAACLKQRVHKFSARCSHPHVILQISGLKDWVKTLLM